MGVNYLSVFSYCIIIINSVNYFNPTDNLQVFGKFEISVSPYNKFGIVMFIFCNILASSLSKIWSKHSTT